MIMINDNNIKKFVENYLKTHKRITKTSFTKDKQQYIINRYNDSEKFNESLYRIINNIEIRPKCRCGNELKFSNIRLGYYKHCSQTCAQSDENVYSKAIFKKIQRYGSANNYDKIKETNLKKYGVEYQLQRKEIQNKIKKTCLDKYNNENYINIDKSKETCLKRYGTEYYLNSDDCKEKTIKKFGVDNYRKTDECKKLVSKIIREKQYIIRNKVKNTCLEKYGVDNYAKSNEFKNKMNWEEQKKKEYETKKKNNSFNKSKIEMKSYELLKEKYPSVKYQYKSDVYPFVCDFFIRHHQEK